MELKHLKGNTWVLDTWALIPLYKLDDHRCILLDTGMWDQEAELDEALQANGLLPVGILCSHAHIDHMGNNAFLKRKYGTKLAMSLGEAGQIASPMGLQLQYYNLAMASFPDFPELGTAPCLPDRVILPGETTIDFCGATFEILFTPGHTVDHICVKTPDNVLYLADAVMTGRVLHRSKFPFALNMETYLDTLGKLRWAEADLYVAAHKGIYTDILPFIDLELRFLTSRMTELLALIGDRTTPKAFTAAICQAYRVHAKSIRSLAYFEQAAQVYLHYLTSTGDVEAFVEEDTIYYRRTPLSFQRQQDREKVILPKTGQLF